MSGLHRPPGFWRTVRLLLSAARKRAAGRRRRQQELLHQRSGKAATDWGGLATVFAALFMVGLNVCAAIAVTIAVRSGERMDAQQGGRVVVSQTFLDATGRAPNSAIVVESSGDINPYTVEAKRIVEDYGGSQDDIERKLRQASDRGAQAFIAEQDAAPGLGALATSGRAAPMLGSLVLLVWLIMLVFQGEGLEVDLQRRRHPLWEWLFGHPVPPGAVFLAEMLSPIAANPVYWGAPLLVGILYGGVYGPALGCVAVLVMGIPVAMATACLGKALEIGVMLRFAPRTRGAVLGIMSWLGFVSMMLFFFVFVGESNVVSVLAGFLHPLEVLPWPILGWLLSVRANGSFSFALGMAACLAFAAATIAAAICFSIWGAQQGLAGHFAATDARPSSSGRRATSFGREPLYRKELLWFLRDRSAIVQTILIPVSLAALEAFNFRFVLKHAQDGWNYLCGAAILFGTYFLWVLGPKSLSSEGSALWIALTWPRGLENLLKAKAWLWSVISSCLVAVVLCYAAFVFPSEIWKIALAGLGWLIFGRSMAEKSVTLVTVASESGEVQKIPWGRRGAAQLGMLTFAIGIVTQQWRLAIVGIVYSYITAAAIWQNFRARLPFLYDPWSETVPPPPTLMHAMVSISLLVEGGAVVTAILVGLLGSGNIGIALSMAYAVCGLIVAMGVASFLEERGVPDRDVWFWRKSSSPSGAESQPWWRGFGPRDGLLLPSLLAAAAGGLLLGIFAHGYLLVAAHISSVAELLRQSQDQMARFPGLRAGYTITAVFFAPFAEEYLFRGLLFRALDREWGGWRAVLGSAAFFAIYHPPLAWIPVGLLGAANALLFKRTGRLAPAVLLHMVYNAVVVS